MKFYRFLGSLKIAWIIGMPAALGLPFSSAQTSQKESPEARILAGAPELDAKKQFSRTYTEKELHALDKALKAANLEREDMNFDKDNAHGHFALPVVKDMLANPLNIAPFTDSLADSMMSAEGPALSPSEHIRIAASLLPDLDADDDTGLFLNSAIPEEGLALPEKPANLGELTASCRVLMDEAYSINFSGWSPMLREYIPFLASWREAIDSPYGKEEQERWEKELENMEDDYLQQKAADVSLIELLKIYFSSMPDPAIWLKDLPASCFPSEAPVIIHTDKGRIGIGTIHNDLWEGNYALLIDPGGDDVYRGCRIGGAWGTKDRRWGYFADLGGDDIYDCRDVDVTLGAALLGVAAFYDLGGGNDRYFCGSFGMGAAACGIASFYDDGGSDVYEGKVYVQGAAAYGIGIMIDDALLSPPDIPADKETPDPASIANYDNDVYRAWSSAQAFARMRSVAVCENRRGNELYQAGGVYLHAPLFSDRYQSFSQGFSIGDRGVDHGGGIALLVDGEGNDRYLGDIYNQGVGYWYGAGLLCDRSGNDVYEMTQYGQGSGIHLAVGGLIDAAGSDSYIMHNGLGQGGSHDWAASVLHDREGHDRYLGSTSCNGSGLTNAVGLFFDRSGDDVYAGKKEGGINYGRPARGTLSIGVLIDTQGQDAYLGIMDDGKLWSHYRFGVGWDVADEKPAEKPQTDIAQEKPEQTVNMPEILSQKSPIDQETFDELWSLACRWEVGDNRIIVPAARNKIVRAGKKILPLIENKLSDNSSLAMRAHQDIFKKLYEKYPQRIRKMLKRKLEKDDQAAKSSALFLAGVLKIKELEDEAVKLLDDEKFRRQTVRVLGQLNSRVGDEKIIDLMKESDSEHFILSAAEKLAQSQNSYWRELRPLMDYPLVSVREAVCSLVAENFEPYFPLIQSELSQYDELNTRMLRSLLRILQLTEPVDAAVRLKFSLLSLLEHEDWGVRADCIKVIKSWNLNDPDRFPQYAEKVNEKLRTLKQNDEEPYVQFVIDE